MLKQTVKEKLDVNLLGHIYGTGVRMRIAGHMERKLPRGTGSRRTTWNLHPPRITSQIPSGWQEGHVRDGRWH